MWFEGLTIRGVVVIILLSCSALGFIVVGLWPWLKELKGVRMRDWILDEYPDIVKMDGYDDCIIGVCHRFGQEPIIAYSYNKIMAKLISCGMSHEDAVEFFEFNQIGAWVGERTPCFIETTAH